ncbi:MAG: Mur ligase domain-containing protein [Candidatus Peregrinibacteria bacterium]|nr:Mur ligase domain-containing protein [Candidatus Peregrinibacteria bacterium]
MKTAKKNIFAIGIGGSGLSGLARMLQEMGHHVSGSDSSPDNAKKQVLRKIGIEIYPTHDASHIDKSIDEVIYSQAIPLTNPERQEAKRKKITSITYPQAVGKYLKDKTKVCIAGTHGKTTTTAMVASILLAAKKDPTVIVGSEVKELNNQNEHLGTSHLAVIETCEYKKSFLDIPPNILIITNIDFDHIDYYKTKARYDAAFLKYMKMVPKTGAIIYLKGEKTVEKLLKKVKHPLAIPVEVEKIKLHIPGLHNQKNASLALAVAKYLDVDPKVALKALLNFSGTKRRLEFIGKKGTTKIYDDYGHHPTEIKATLEAIRELYPKGKILTIFQPHQYSRTKAFLKDFATAFTQTDKLIVPNIYEARDTAKDKESVNITKLVSAINAHQPKKATDGNGIEETILFAKKNISAYDVIITMGAGNVNQICAALVR